MWLLEYPEKTLLFIRQKVNSWFAVSIRDTPLCDVEPLVCSRGLYAVKIHEKREKCDY